MNTPHTNVSKLTTPESTEEKSALSIAAISRWLFQDSKPLPKWPVTMILAICISVAIAASGYLLWAGLTSSPIAGCGNSGGWIDCDNVATSRWSLWLGIPVSFLALAIYLVLATALVVATMPQFNLSMRKWGWVVVTAAVFAAGMSAVWFIALQLLVLQHICVYCMVAHACGLIATATILLAGPLRAKSTMAIAGLSAAGFLILVVGQLITTRPDTFEIERFDIPTMMESETLEFAPIEIDSQGDDDSDDGLFSAPVTDARDSSGNVNLAGLMGLPSLFIAGIVQSESAAVEPAAAERRVVAIQGGAVKLDVAQWPHVGSTDAKYVFVSMFDYNCPPCRETGKAIESAREQLGDQLTIVLLPLPLNSDCNPTVAVTSAPYRDSCDLSKLVVAVWRVDASQLAALHEWISQGDSSPSYVEAKAKAETLVDANKLDAELASGIPDQYIARHVEIYKRVGQGSIPKLMFPRTSVVGRFTSVDGLVELIRREAL